MKRHGKHLIAAGALAIIALSRSPAIAQDVDFGRQIRPLLAEKCLSCHGLDEENRQTDMRLDTKEGLFAEIESGGVAIAPGNPDDSLLYQRLVDDDEDVRMPPAESEKEVTAAEIDLIKRWISEGAAWKQHWSLVTPERPDAPDVADENWPRSAIDRFILARLEREGLQPSPQADKETMIRRVTLDLTGLPPTPKEIDAYVADDSPDAYEKVVDRLLKSPHYGEHMARYWLDAARYADTHGLHFDNFRQIWPYRDWVINAFNDNMPFDRFTIEQLGGDLLPGATPQQRIATGFNRCNVTTNEGGVIPEEYYVHYTVDRVATMSTVWMGASMGCVICHDHKFDPYKMKDFYQLFAFFNSLKGPVMDGNQALPAPILQMPNPANQPRIDELAGQLAVHNDRLAARVENVSADFNTWQTAQRNGHAADALIPSDGLVGHWDFDETEGDAVHASAAELASGSLSGAQRVEGKFGGGCRVDNNEFVDLGDVADYERQDAFSYGAWVHLQPGNGGSAVVARMDDGNQHRGYDLYIAGDKPVAHIIHSWPDNSIKVQAKEPVALDRWQHLLVTYDGSGKAAGVAIYVDGQSVPLNVLNDSLRDTIRADVSLTVGRRTPGSPLKGIVDDVRIYDRALSETEAASLAGGSEIRDILAIAPQERTDEQRGTLRQFYLENHDEPYKQLRAEVAELAKEKIRLETNGRIESLVWKELAEPKPAYILIRGQYDKRGEQVVRNTPAALPPLPALGEGEIPTRLTLARWLVSPEHPLTSRVTVNRFWQQYFGAGIVRTSEDFGSQGSPPSHSALLDWLAVDFRESGWDVRRLQKLIVMSATYRQSSTVRPELLDKDPENRLLARGPRFRMDAEMIRDTALAASGLLARKIGGPSVKPYQPAGIWYAVGYTDSNTANFKQDTGEALYRRGLYTFWKRTAPPPALATLDAPSRETCTVRRSRTNTPLAALALLNDVQFVEAARHLATRVMIEGGSSDEQRVTLAFRLATGRRPNQQETEVLLGIYRELLAKYEQDSKAADKLIHVGESPTDDSLESAQLAAWTMIANLILNLDETVTKG